jgi:Glycine zipper
MKRFLGLTIGLATLLSLAMPAPQAVAQENTIGGAILGGAAGAIIGGAATGRAGGAVAGGIIGAAAGAAIGSQFEPRRGGYYWYDGRCWRRHPNGDYHRVSRRYCGG